MTHPGMRFSSRLGTHRETHPLSAALRVVRGRGTEVLDLTPSNPTTAGLEYDHDAITAAVANGAFLAYEPDPRGSLRARERIAAYYASLGCQVLPEQVHLTASSSEAYSWLFKLLADPGDDILAPRPAYPLFHDLASLEGLILQPYTMRYHGPEGWRLDRTSLDAALGERTRALLAVHPANPTGAYIDAGDLRYLADFCDAHGLAFIVDEVFFDYRLSGDATAMPVLALERQHCTFVLNGFSKMLGLPQMKLGWIVSAGAEPLLREARERLDHIADTYLSVGAPVQAAAEQLFATRDGIQQRIRDRCVGNLAQLRRRIAGNAALTLLPPEGGWSAVLRLERGGTDEDAALMLLNEHGVLVHPGAFFDFAFGEHLVVSLLTDPRVFAEGIARMDDALRESP